MASRRIARSALAVFIVGFLVLFLSTLLAPGAWGALVQLKNDNNTAGGYSSTWEAGDVIGAVLTPEDYMYPVRVLSVEFALYNGFAGADDSVTVRVCIYSLYNGRPDAQLGCSGPTNITTFAPSLVSVSLDPSEIVIELPDSFMVAVEYLTGVVGHTPSTLTDTSTNILQGKNYYSFDGGTTWYEHYDVWADPGQVGFNIIRATVDTNYGEATPTRLFAPTRTPTPVVPATEVPTPVPRATPYPCISGPSDHLCYLPLVLREWQAGPTPLPTPPPGAELLGVKGYWPYVSMAVGDHELLVNVGNGNLLLGRVDQAIPAPGIDSVLVRTFNALSGYGGEFGSGWTSNMGNTMRLWPRDNDSVVFFGPSGEIEVFAPQAGGFVPPPGFHYTLEHEMDGTYTLTGIADGIELRFTAQGQLSSVVDRNGNTQSYQRDGAGKVIEIVDSAGLSTILAYSNGLVTSVQDRAGRVSEYRYDASGQLTHYVNPAGHMTEYHYDDCHDLTEVVDAGGHVWTFGYDSEGRVVLVTDPLGQVTQFTYQEGQTILTDANEHNTVYRYDVDGKLLERIDANAHGVQFGWDPFFNLARITGPLGHQTQFSWQGSTGLLTAISDPLTNTTSYGYDVHNNLSLITDARGNTTRFEYDATGANLLRVIQADGSEITFTYDSRGNPLTVIDPSGNAGDPANPIGLPHHFDYNSYGYLTDAYDPLGNHWTYSWDDGTGNLLSLRDAKGQLTQYSYDDLDRLTGVAYADGTGVTFAYDALGNLTSMTDGHGTTSYTYDATGQLRTEDDPRTGGVHEYDYDAVGNLLRITRDSGDVLTFDYDPADRLTSQGNPFDGGKPITYRYDADGRLLDIFYPNGDQSSYSYYANGWLESLLTTDADSMIYDRYEFPSQSEGGYDANGNPLQITRAIAIFNELGELDWMAETWRMRYDALNRIIQQDGYDGNKVWQWQVTVSYNPNGLWSTRTYDDVAQSQSWDYHYDAAARWTGVSFWDGRQDVVINDANGNQTEIREEFFTGTAAAGDVQFLPSLLDEPAAATLLRQPAALAMDDRLQASAIVTHTTAFEYDAADRLERVTDPQGNWYTFAYDGIDRIIEVDSSGFTAPKYQHYDLLGMARETQSAATANYLYDLADNVRANQVEGLPCQYLHRDPRGQITHISDDLLAYFDYCFMGNVQAGGVNAGDGVVGIYEPFLSDDFYITPISDTWQSGILYYIDEGEFWPHNSQLSTRNRDVAPSMRNLTPLPWWRDPLVWDYFWRGVYEDLMEESLPVQLLDALPFHIPSLMREMLSKNTTGERWAVFAKRMSQNVILAAVSSGLDKWHDARHLGRLPNSMAQMIKHGNNLWQEGKSLQNFSSFLDFYSNVWQLYDKHINER